MKPRNGVLRNSMTGAGSNAMERIRRAGKKIKEEHAVTAPDLDAGYADDSMKINAEQLFKALSPSTEVKTI